MRPHDFGWVRTAAQFAYLVICLETIFSVPYWSVWLATHSDRAAWAAAFCVMVVVGICFKFRRPILNNIRRVLSLPSIGNKQWNALWLAIGLGLRLGWILRFPTAIRSDHLAYFNDAAQMANWHTPTGTYWPPGFSLFLAPFFMVFGAHPWVAHLASLFLFVAIYFLTYFLAEQIQGGLTARIAPALIALWPCEIMLTGINCKETFLAAIIPACLLLYLKASGRSSFRWSLVIAAGLCMGLTALSQPGYILFPSVIFAFEIVRRTGVLTAIGRTAIFTLAMLVAISPWTYRNYLVLHQFVLISTNGGAVFYAANSPSADPFVAPETDVASLPKDELASNRIGYQAGEQWIEQHPIAFTILMLKKQIVTVGDDGSGAYETLKREHKPSALLYASAKGVSNLYWLALWAILLLGIPRVFELANWRLWYGLLFLPVAYQWVIDSIFVSGSRHHLPYISLIAVMVGIAITSATNTSSASDNP
jgi:4-amino-4-deoxy-L-arabinose transferase-like glycosyltransferase